MIGKAADIASWLFRQEDRDAVYKIEVYREKRSLNANAYAWALIGEIADVLRASKDEVYLTMLKRYGQSEIISVRADINLAGYCKYFEEVGTGEINGKLFKHYKIFKGSSEYNRKEMAILIDGIVSEAKELDIQVLSAEDLARLRC